MTHLTTPLKPRFKQAPAHRPRLADDIYEQILSAILEGDIVPGERMVQESVARETT
jgi:DNA-binding GntR family transcriptional regulator